MKVKRPIIVCMILFFCLSSIVVFGQEQGTTHSGNSTYTPSNDNYGSATVHYEYAFNGTQIKIKISQVIIELSVAMRTNEPELENELRKRGILPVTQQSGAGVSIDYTAIASIGLEGRFSVSGYAHGTTTEYTFFEPDEKIKEVNRRHYEQTKKNYYNDWGTLTEFKITDFQYPDLDEKIDAVRRELAETKKQKEKEEQAKKEAEEKEKAEKEKPEQEDEAKEAENASGGSSGSSGSNTEKEEKSDNNDTDTEPKESGRKSTQTVYYPKTNRQLYDELKALTDATPALLNDPKVRSQLRSYKALADRDDRNVRDYNTLERTMGGGYHPDKVTAMNSIYQTNANIANAEASVGAAVDAATGLVNSIVEANNRKEQQRLAENQRRIASHQDKVKAIKNWEYQILQERREYEQNIESQIKADFTLVETIDDLPIIYESEKYIEKGYWDGHFEKATKTMKDWENDVSYKLYLVEMEGLFGILGDDGEALYPPQFEGIYAFNDAGKRPRFLVNIEGNWGEILADGSIAEDIKYGGIWYSADKERKILKQGNNWQEKSLLDSRLLRQFSTQQIANLYTGGLIPVINTNLNAHNVSGSYSLNSDGQIYGFGDKANNEVESMAYESVRRGQTIERLYKISGKWFVTANYGTKSMTTIEMPEKFVVEALRETESGKKWGAINQDGEIVVPFEHNFIKRTIDGFTTDRGNYNIQ